MQIPQPALDALLDAQPVARLATVRADGRPHLVPIVFTRAGGALWSPIDAKPKRDREPLRVQNLRREPRVTLLVDHYDGDWTRLWWIRADGVAEVRTPRSPEADPAAAEAVAALRRKYPQYDGLPVLRDPPAILRIRIERLASWCPGPRPPSPARA